MSLFRPRPRPQGPRRTLYEAPVDVRTETSEREAAITHAARLRLLEDEFLELIRAEQERSASWEDRCMALSQERNTAVVEANRLRHENKALTERVEALEAALAEYRRREVAQHHLDPR